jgi:Ca2+-binding EF-hand superfamily protein
MGLGKIKDVAKREENLIELIKSDPKYKNVEWTPARLEQLKKTAHDIVVGSDQHDPKVKLQKVEFGDVMKRGWDAVKQGNDKEIDKYSDLVAESMRQSGQPQWEVVTFVGGLRYGGHVVAGVVHAYDATVDFGKSLFRSSAENQVNDLLKSVNAKGWQNSATADGKKIFDLDGDGKISLDEITKVFNAHGIATEDFAKVLDTDGKNGITGAELSTRMQKIANEERAKDMPVTGETLKRFVDAANKAGYANVKTADGKAIFDRDGNGKVDENELAAMLDKYKFTEHSMDVNGNGLTANEVGIALQKVTQQERAKYEAEHPHQAPHTPATAKQPPKGMQH